MRIPSPTPEVADAGIALRIAVGSREYDPEPDINSDGRVTSLDALMILQVREYMIAQITVRSHHCQAPSVVSIKRWCCG